MVEGTETELAPLREFEIPDINLPSVIKIKETLLNVEDIPERAVIILALKALGFNNARVASFLKTSRQLVRDYVVRYDPKGLCEVSDETKRMITTQMLHSSALAALMEITHEKLQQAPAKDLASIASKCMLTAEKLNSVGTDQERDKATRIACMMDSLDMAEEA